MNRTLLSFIFLTASLFGGMPSVSVLAASPGSGDEFTLNAIGDVQVGDDEELSYAVRSLWPMLQNQPSTSLNLFLGDLVNNNVELYLELSRLISLLPSHNYAVVGNHDRIPLLANPTDWDSARVVQTEPFRKAFGPDYYSFDYQRLHVIVLNNVLAKGKRGYTGAITRRQLDFVADDLRKVKKNRRILLAMHIPLARTSNRDQLLKMLEHRDRVIVLTGHMHQVARHRYNIPGTRVDELVAGATCGFWWVGEKNFRGVPSALMQCGTPKGYFQFHFTRGGLAHTYRFVPTDSRSEVNVWVAGRDTLDRHVAGLDTIADGRVLVTRIRLYPCPDTCRWRTLGDMHACPLPRPQCGTATDDVYPACLSHQLQQAESTSCSAVPSGLDNTSASRPASQGTCHTGGG